MAKRPTCQCCSNDAVVAGLCKACYNAFSYWGYKTPGQKVKRMQDLEKYHRRMEIMSGVASASRPGSKKKSASKKKAASRKHRAA